MFIINGISVLIGDCAAVTFDDSRRISGRAFIIRATCLNEQQAVASDIPTWMGGWGLILLGILAITAFLWLTPILRFFARRKAEKEEARQEWAVQNEVASRHLPHQVTLEGKTYTKASPNAVAELQGLYSHKSKWYRIDGGGAERVPVTGWQKLPRTLRIALWLLLLSPFVVMFIAGVVNNS